MDYDETDEQGMIENRDRTRPELASHVENLDSYDIVFLGFPNWYYDMPMIMYSFLDQYDLAGKTVVPLLHPAQVVFLIRLTQSKRWNRMRM